MNLLLTPARGLRLGGGLLRHSPALTMGSDRRRWASSSSTSEAIVIGGGVIGASSAYHLAKRGVKVTLLERDKLTSGTTWHSAAMLFSPRADTHDAHLAGYTKKLCLSGQLEEETGVSPGYVAHGGLSVTRDPERLLEYKRMLGLGSYLGDDTVLVSPSEAKSVYPMLNTDGIVGGMFSETDGSIDPTGITNAFTKGAKIHGATVIENCPVEDLIVKEGKIKGVRTKSGELYSDTVVLAAGAWSRSLAARAGVRLPLKTNKHSYLITDIVPGITQMAKDGRKLPNLRVFDDAIYLKVQNETIYVGYFESNPAFVDPVEPDLVFGQYDQPASMYEPYLEAAYKAVPDLAKVGLRGSICGPESFTPDGKQLFGEAPEVRGLYLNCAMNSKGVQSSGGFGLELANLILDGRTSTDMFGYDISRFHDAQLASEGWLEQGVHESEVRTYWIGYPTRQRYSGRNLRLSPIHGALSARGAFLSCVNGFEIPRFFMPELAPLDVPEYDWYGEYGHTKRASPTAYEEVHSEYAGWNYPKRVSAAIRAEVQATRKDVALFDQSSFGHINVSGPDAHALLDRVSTAPVPDKGSRACAYTLFLNHAGGVEADLTLARNNDGKEDFYLTTAGPAAKYVVRYLNSHLQSEELVDIKDASDATSILSLQGPNSRELLSKVTSADISNDSLPFSTFKDMEVAGSTCRVFRLTYVGELGFELHVPTESASSVLDALLSARPDLPFAGFEALSTMSVERGFRHWHGDVDPTDSPLEAGLGFALARKRREGKGFVGKEAVERLENEGIKRKLVHFTVAPSVPLNGSEPIYRDGALVGYLVRGTFGHTVGLGLGAGYLKRPDGAAVEKAWLEEGRYEVGVFGERFPAEVHTGPVFKGNK